MGEIIEYKGIIILILVISGVAFYWYEWRPSIIKKDCYNEAKEKALEKSSRQDTLDGIFNPGFKKEDYNSYYKWCLQSKGL